MLYTNDVCIQIIRYRHSTVDNDKKQIRPSRLINLPSPNSPETCMILQTPYSSPSLQAPTILSLFLNHLRIRISSRLQYRPPQPIKRIITTLTSPPLLIPPEIFNPVQFTVEFVIKYHQMSTSSHLLLHHPLLLPKIGLQLHDISPTTILNTSHASSLCVVLPILATPHLTVSHQCRHRLLLLLFYTSFTYTSCFVKN
jgi:hypothetical protein